MNISTRSAWHALGASRPHRAVVGPQAKRERRRLTAWDHSCMDGDIPEVTALAINVAIPEALRWICGVGRPVR